MSIFFIKYDFIVQVSPIVSYVLISLYCIINLFIILQFKMQSKHSGTVLILMAILYALYFYSENFWYGLPIIFLIAMAFKERMRLTVRITSASITAVLFLSLLVSAALPVGRQELTKIYNSEESIAVVLTYVDTGATGGSHKYQAELAVIKDLLYIRKTINTYWEHEYPIWIDSNTIRINKGLD